MKFRDDIQGLRALAILPVVAYHASARIAPGGYVGVDIFFVISGYLITRILLGEIAEGRFSIPGFYVRRVKRLFPALYVMLVAVLIAGLILLPPDALSQLARTALATIGFVVNFRAAASTGYFAEKAATQPLLHTWSLAVEEQFYVLFPVLLWLAWRYARRALPLLLWGLGAASLAWAVIAAGRNPDAAFFSSAGRAYELVAGVLLAAGAVPKVERAWLRDMLSVAGLAMVAAAVALFDDQTQTPGYAALLPVTGAALIIAAGETGPSLGGRVLSWRPLVFIGTLSYSLYLWHWPILVYLRWIDLGTPALLELVGAVALAVVLAWLSWRFVERPVLAGAWPKPRVLIAGAATMAVAAAATLPLIALHGVPQRFSPAALAMLDARNDLNDQNDRCERRDDLTPYAKNCVYGAAAAPTTAIWGDSFASEIAAIAGERAAARGEAVLEVRLVGCPPTLGYAIGGHDRCRKSIGAVLNDLIADKNIRTVLLAVHYKRYPDQTKTQLMDGLARTATALHDAGKQVVLLDQVPGVPFSDPTALMLTVARGGDPAAYGWPRAEYDRVNAMTRARLDALAAKIGALRIHPQDALCSAQWCYGYKNGVGALYLDEFHMTLSGARLVLAQSGFLPPARRAAIVSGAMAEWEILDEPGMGMLTDRVSPVALAQGGAAISGEPSAYAPDFARDRAFAFADFLSPDFAATLAAICRRATFVPDDGPHAQTRHFVERRTFEEPRVAGGAIGLALQRPEVLRWFEAATGCGPLASAYGSVMRVPADGQSNLWWHDDLGTDPTRRLGITIYLGDQPYAGGLFELREKTGNLLARHHHATFASALIFDVDPALEHRLSPVTAGGPRQVFTGWMTRA